MPGFLLAIPYLGQLVAFVVLCAVTLLLELSPAIQALDRRLESLWASAFYTNKASLPFLLIAVDGETVREFGCPPYSEVVLDKIEYHLSFLGIEQLLLPDGADRWLQPALRNKKGRVSYLVPRLFAWDSYLKQWQSHLPEESKRIKPINATALSSRGNRVAVESVVELLPGDPPKDFSGQVLAWWMAEYMQAGTRQAVPSEVIRFLGPAGSVPTLPLSRVLQSDFTAEDVGRRLVVLGLTEESCALQLPVPTDPRGLSFGEFQIHAAATLYQSPVTQVKGLWRYLLVVLSIAISMLVLRNVRIGLRLPLVGVAMVCWILTVLLFSRVAQVLMPFIGPIVGHLLSFFYLSYYHSNLLICELRENNLRLAGALRKQTQTPELQKDATVQQAFDSTVGFLRLLFPISQGFLFLTNTQGTHVTLAGEVDGSEADIGERRRDIRRRPWRDVLLNPSGDYMDHFLADRDKKTYGVAMNVLGKCVGILVIAVEKRTQISENVRRILERLCQQLAVVVAGPEFVRPDQGVVRRIFKTVVEADNLRLEVGNIKRITNLVVSHFERYRAFLDHMNVGVAFADLMGNVYYSNSFATKAFSGLDIHFPCNLRYVLGKICAAPGTSAIDQLQSAILGESVPSISYKDSESGKLYHVEILGLSIPEGTEEARPDDPVTALLLTIREESAVGDVRTASADGPTAEERATLPPDPAIARRSRLRRPLTRKKRMH